MKRRLKGALLGGARFHDEIGCWTNKCRLSAPSVCMKHGKHVEMVLYQHQTIQYTKNRLLLGQ